MFLIETFGENLIEEEIDLVDRVEFGNVRAVIIQFETRGIAKLRPSNIFVLQHLVELTLLPSIFDAPIHLLLGTLLLFGFVLRMA